MSVKTWLMMLGSLLVASFLTAPAQGDVVREYGVTSIAGALGGATGNSAAEWTFKSSGDEILFASLDADIYRKAPGGEHDEGDVHATAETGHEPGSCSGDDEGGPGVFCLQVIGPSGQTVCHSARPAPPPGWQRDPRLACVLPTALGQQTYWVRVALSDGEGSCKDPNVAGIHSSIHPFLLNVSLRRIAGSGIGVQTAGAQSGNRF